MANPNPTVWLPGDEVPELAPPPPELLVPGAELDPVPRPVEDPAMSPVVEDASAAAGALVDPDAPAEPGALAVADDSLVVENAPVVDDAPAPADGTLADPDGPVEEITPEILAALPIELLGIAPRTVLSPDPFVTWGLGLGVGAVVLTLIPPFWWMFGLVAGATAFRVGWTAWVRSTGLYFDRRPRALAVLGVAGLALAIGAVVGLRFFADVSQISAG